MKPIGISIWLLLTSSAITVLAAPPPVIGTAQSAGSFLVNQSAVPGSATVLNGADIRTTAASSEVRLAGGAQLTLAAASGATLFQNRAVLVGGAVELRSAPGYLVEARNLRVSAKQGEADITIAMESPDRVIVAARAGKAEVRSAAGVLLASMQPGEALAFDAAPAETVRFSGILTRSGNLFFLADDTSHIVAQLRGANLESLVGKHISVTGTPGSGTPAAGASRIVNVTETNVTPATPPSGRPKPAAVASGVSMKTISIAAGAVAAGGTVGGLAVAGAFSGNTVSR